MVLYLLFSYLPCVHPVQFNLSSVYSYSSCHPHQFLGGHPGQDLNGPYWNAISGHSFSSSVCYGFPYLLILDGLLYYLRVYLSLVAVIEPLCFIAPFPVLLHHSLGFFTEENPSFLVLVDLLGVHIHVLIDGRLIAQGHISSYDVLDTSVVAPWVRSQGLEVFLYVRLERVFPQLGYLPLDHVVAYLFLEHFVNLLLYLIDFLWGVMYQYGDVPP